MSMSAGDRDRLARLTQESREQDERARAAKQRRDMAIVECHLEQGYTMTEIARAAGLAKSGVSRIIGDSPVVEVV